MEIKNLSNENLEKQLHQLVLRERQTLHLIILHIREVDVRRLYLERGYPSLFQYLVEEFAYSAGVAYRRIEAARLLKDLPNLTEKIKTGAVNLSQIGELSRALKQKHKESSVPVPTGMKQKLFAQIENQSTETTQTILAQELDLKLKPPVIKCIQKDESVHIQMSLSKELYANLELCKNRAAHLLLKNKKSTDLVSLIELLAERFLKEGDPKGKPHKNPENASEATAVVAEAAKSSRDRSISAAEMKSAKTITPKMRKEILKQYPCCHFKSSADEKICGSSFALEVDHIVPLWAGGSNAKENLTSLCSLHNKYKYRKQSQMQFKN